MRTRLPTKFVKYRKFQTKFRYIYSENNVPLTALKMHSATEGGHTLVTYFAEDGVFEDLRMSAILEKKGTSLYPDAKYVGQNPLTIQETYAALTPRHSKSIWASEFAAPTCCR